MGSDLFISHSCPYRKDGDTSLLQGLLRLKRYLDAMESGAIAERSIRLKLAKGPTVTEQLFTEADLKLQCTRLNEIFPVCENCPANLKKPFGFRRTIGCQVYISSPLDDFAERILYETLVENAKAERASTVQSNLVRALVSSTPADGRRWRALASPGRDRTSAGITMSLWGSRPVTVIIDGAAFHVTVHALAEMLFLFSRLPIRAVEDILSFFRSFFAVVGSYVSTPDGKLDQRRNELFWRRSPALNELNLYIQLLKHALRLDRMITTVQSD
ncbi:MAG: hypothetical protein JW797_17765 [Bradymonadales bacterium]|nr:hypothetical protein [Bradymonadales bacterium]